MTDWRLAFSPKQDSVLGLAGKTKKKRKREKIKEFNGRWELTLIDLTRRSASFDVSLGPSQLSVYNDCNLQKTQIASYYPQLLPQALVSQGCRYTGFQIQTGEEAKDCTSGNTRAETLHSLWYTALETLPKVQPRKSTPQALPQLNSRHGIDGFCWYRL